MPPSWPAMTTWSALALATPAATVPTPTSATSFTRDLRLRVRAAQVVDQLLEVLDRVDVVVRRRRDQADARGRVADRADVLVDLVAGQLAALAGLGALGHLDLQLVGVDQVVDRHAEAARGHLLDRRAAQVAVGVALEAARVLAALARVRAPAEAVHGDREVLVGLGGDRAQRHRAGGEALDDLLGRLDLVERDRLGGRRGTSAARAASPCAWRRSLTIRAYSSYLSWACRSCRRTACCSAAIVSGFHMWCSPSRRQA